MITKTQIQSRLHSLISDRMWCMAHGKMNKTGDLVAICSKLDQELNFHRLHGHNAHMAIIRHYSADIVKLASTIGKKEHLRNQVLEMVLPYYHITL